MQSEYESRNLISIDAYEIRTAFDAQQTGLAILPLKDSMNAFVLLLDLPTIEVFRKHLASAELFLKTKSGNA